MNIGESIRIALGGLAANKMRSALTMLGIIIGVGAVITLLSVGQGVEAYVTGQFQSIGSNLLFVMPGSLENSGPPGSQQARANLTYADAKAIADPLAVPDVIAVAAKVYRFAPVVYGNEAPTTQIAGVTPNYPEVRNFYVELGRFISEDDVVGNARVAVLGQTVVEKLFGDNVYPLGQTIKINKIPFRVIGVMEEKGGSAFGDEDDVVFVPLTTAQVRLFPDRTVSGEYRLSVIYAQVIDEDHIDTAADQITELLRQRHGITYQDDDDFSIISQADIISIFGEITRILTIFLGSVAGISLLVGGIGIMNIMLVSVTERTREIGIRKAVGAKRRDILMQFLIEAMVMSLIGGFIGILLGWGGSALLGKLVKGLNTLVTPGAVLLSTGFSAAVGLFFGIYPATRAAWLHPIEALRYE